MADTKYLQKRRNCWYVRVPRPPHAWGMSGEFVCTLRTPDLKTAQRLRDKYLIPLLAETAAGDMVSAIARAAAASDEAIARQLARLNRDLGGLRDDVTLREAADQFLAYLRRGGGYAPATVEKHASSLDAACRLLGDDASPAALTKRDAVGFRDTLSGLPANWQRKKEVPRAPTSGQRIISARIVQLHLANLRRLFRWLLDEGRIARASNPFDGVGVARVTTKHKRAPTSDEAEALCNLPCPTSIEVTTWALMPLLARYTGCRAGELSQLRAVDVVERQGIACLSIRGDVKTPSSIRLVPLADRIRDEVVALAGKRPQGTLMKAGDYTSAAGAVKRAHSFLKSYNRRAKAVAPDLSFHCWRVYANDAMATGGVDIGDRERLLGHKSGRTQAAYTPENLHRLKAAVDTIP